MKNIIITGGSSGIGKQCALLFKNNGYNVIVIDIIKCNISNINSYLCDISNEQELKIIIKNIYNKYKTIDILINNAAVQVSKSFEKYSCVEWKKIMENNYIGTCNMIYYVSKLMKSHSTILNISSVHSYKPRKNKYAYDCSKSAIDMLTKELALELADKNITINSLSFGAVNTEMNDIWKNNLDLKIQAKSKVPLKIIFEPIQIANFCKIIVEKFSQYTTGSIFVIDGGRSLL